MNRLSGWKAIAAYFETTVRTVQRWERQEGMPVERVLRSKREAVFADETTLKEWTRRRSRPVDERPNVSVAVLPFASPQAAWLGEELAAELIQTFAASAFPRVIGRVSSFALAGTGMGQKEVMEKLGASLLVEGEVAGGRVNVRLIGGQGQTIWSETYGAGPMEAWERREEILQSVCGHLRMQLPRVRRPSTTKSAVVFEKWLKARSLFLTLRPEEVRQGIALAEEVVAQDPGFAQAVADLGAFYAQLAVMGMVPPRSLLARWNELLDRAIELDDQLADALFWKARSLALFDRKWEEAEVLYRRALELEPNHVLAHYFYAADFLRVQGRHEEALLSIGRAIVRDPLSPMHRMGAAQIYAAMGQDALAMESVEAGNRLAHGQWTTGWLQGMLYLRAGNTSMAWELLGRAYAEAPLHCWVEGCYAAACLESGRVDEVRLMLEAALRDRRNRYVPASTLAFLYAVAGDDQSALDWFEKALEELDPILLYQPKASFGMVLSPAIDERLRRDSRWGAIVAAMNL